MARKNVLRFQIETAKSLAASFTTAPTVVKFLDNCSYQINVTGGGSSGTFAVQVSNDYSEDEPSGTVQNAGNWVDLNIGGTPQVAGVDDKIIIDLNQLPFQAVRIAYTSTVAGAGSCNIIISCKQIGG